MTALAELRTDLLAAATGAADLAALEEVRIKALGKKGALTEQLKSLGALSEDQRRTHGAAVNELKTEITTLLETRRAALEDAALNARLATETIDITLPVAAALPGRIHPISQTMEEIIAIFTGMGFDVGDVPNIENDFNNFGALNFPDGHPAREMHDTFYLPPAPDRRKMLLRTHTSTIQIHTMLSRKPPFRIIATGRTYRSDHDMTHTPMFHQCDGIVVEDKVTMAHLKGTLQDFLRAFFNVDDLPVRLRPSFFPFVEPGAEMDIGCSRKGGELKLGNYGDWLEILGCGMVHPNVLEACGVDSTKYQGFAWGMGVERLAMLKYGIPDLRTFFDSDLRWLKHYGFNWLQQPMATGF